jgi:hypothetical protein
LIAAMVTAGISCSITVTLKSSIEVARPPDPAL